MSRSIGFLLATSSATCALIALDTNIVAVALPSIARSLHASFAQVEWVVSAYLVSFASCLLPMGGLADRFGRKRIMLWGQWLFLLASLLCGVAPNVFMLIAARALKGAGAAMLLTSALAVIAHAFSAPQERARAWAFWGSTMAIATTIAPFVGGVLAECLGWRWIFLINLPLCGCLIICTQRMVTDSRNPQAHRIDLAGSASFSAGLGCGIWALISMQEQAWNSTENVLRLSACVLLILVFIVLERHRSHAVIDLKLFSQARFVAAVLGMFGYAACAQVMMTLLPLYLQNSYEWTPVAAGAGMLPFALSMIAGAYLGARVAPRLDGMTSILSLGLLIVGTGNLCAAGAALTGDYVWMALSMLVTGLGAGMLNGDTQKVIMACVPPQRAGMASGISTTTRFTAIVMSVAILGAILAQQTHAALKRILAASGASTVDLPPSFISNLLAGDRARALASIEPQWRQLVSKLAPMGFAHGFASVLATAGIFSLGCAMAIFLLERCSRSQAAVGAQL